MPFTDPIVDETGELVVNNIHSAGYMPVPATGWSIDRDGNSQFARVIAGAVQMQNGTGSLLIGSSWTNGDIPTDPDGFPVVGLIWEQISGQVAVIKAYADHGGDLVVWDIVLNSNVSPVTDPAQLYTWYRRTLVPAAVASSATVVEQWRNGFHVDVSDGTNARGGYLPYAPVRVSCNALFTANVGAFVLVPGTQVTVKQVGANDGFMVDIIGNAVSSLVPTGRLQIALFVDGVQKGSQAEWVTKEAGETQMVNTREWVTGLGVGDHVFEMRANISAGAAGQYTLDTGETKMIIDPRWRG